MRYRIEVSDTLDVSVMVPYEDDASKNFAYFVYDQIPSWTGAVEPGKTLPVGAFAAMLRSQ